MCDVLQVSRSGFYRWSQAIPSNRARANQRLDIHIKALFIEHKARYGAPRILMALLQAGIRCSKKRVASRMKIMDIRAKAKGKFRATTDSGHQHPVFSNILNRDFNATTMDQKWVSDITYVHTKQGWLYLAVVIDLYSRSIIGWSMSKRIDKDLVCNALLMALFRRKFPKGVVVHSDRGSQYCSKKYRKILSLNGLIGSMSRKGNCWDNAPCESFFHTLKVELIQNRGYETRAEAKQEIFSYIESYYNKKRMHSAIDYRTPYEMECEQKTRIQLSMKSG